MNILERIKLFFTTRCRFAKTCNLYRKDNFSCEHQESDDAISCGRWRSNIGE